MAFDKIIQYDSHPDRDGEALIHPAEDGMTKTAGEVHPDVQEYLAEAESLPDKKMRLLITALSAFDTFGPNKNGDGFYKKDLLNEMDYGSHPEAMGENLKIPMFRSFEYFARPYKHHVNNEDSPAYGNIEKSFFNPKMDRTELVVVLDANKAPEVARRIQNYEPVSTSMGFRASYDQCACASEKVRTPLGIKDLEEIEIGDKVLTHKGRYKRVIRTFKHKRTEPIVAINAVGATEPMEVTANHPTWVVKNDQVHYPSGTKRDNPDWTPNFVRADNVDVSDYLVRNVRNLTGEKDVPKEAAYLAGQYLGDGHISSCKNKDGSSETIVITTHGQDYDIQEKIFQSAHALARKGWQMDCLSIYDQNRDYRDKHAKKDAASIRIHCKKLAKLCREFCGRLKNKCIKEPAFDLDKESALHLIGGYVDADGSYGEKSKTVRTLSVLDDLSYTMQELMIACGLPPSMHKDYFGESYKESGFNSNYDYATVLKLSKTRTWRLSDYSVRVKAEKPNTMHRTKYYFEHDGHDYLACPVQSVEVDDDHPEETVYNLSVEGDETYTIRNWITHNCSVCGNKASSRAEYCDHLKNNMLDVRPDGHIIHARNPKGKFFDISFLPGVEPADSTSRAVFVGQLSQDGQNEEEKSEPEEESSSDENEKNEEKGEEKEAMKKVALSADIAEQFGYDGEEPLRLKTADDDKTSAIDKKVKGEVKPEYSGENGKRVAKVVRALRQSEPLMPISMIEQLASMPLDRIGSSMARCGMTLKPEEAQHIALIRSGAPNLGRRLRRLKKVLVPSKGKSLKADKNKVELSKEKSSPKVIKIVMKNKPLARSRSMLRPVLLDRMQGLSEMDEQEKTAALGPNPYLQHREPIGPAKAHRMASEKERKRMERLRSSDKASAEQPILDMIASALRSAAWKGHDERIPERSISKSLRKDPRPARRGRRIQPRRRTVRRQRSRRGGMAGRQAPAGHTSTVMTAPMAYYMQGVGTHKPIYDQAGLVEGAMNKDASFKKRGYQALCEIDENMNQIKSRDEHVKQAVSEKDLLEHDDPKVAEAAGILLLSKDLKFNE